MAQMHQDWLECFGFVSSLSGDSVECGIACHHGSEGFIEIPLVLVEACEHGQSLGAHQWPDARFTEFDQDRVGEIVVAELGEDPGVEDLRRI